MVPFGLVCLISYYLIKLVSGYVVVKRLTLLILALGCQNCIAMETSHAGKLQSLLEAE